jgi:phospholipid/cholesterol/gamma-HCH transport system ATP-binding protein
LLALEGRQQAVQFGAQHVLEGVTISAERGRNLILLGRSGCGKSVLLKSLIGLIKPDAGSIKVEGVEITGLPERKLGDIRRKVGYMFQGGALFDSLTVMENVAFPLRESGLKDQREIRQRVLDALDMVDLSSAIDKMPGSLSGGMRKRVSLARTVVARPACILYDKPTAGLDPIATNTINRLIRRFQEQLCVTAIVVTHELRTVNAAGDHVALMHHGRIHFYGTPAELWACEDPIVSRFVKGESTEAVGDDDV